MLPPSSQTRSQGHSWRGPKKETMKEPLLPIGTRVEHRKHGLRGYVARHDYGQNIVAADQVFCGKTGMMADGFWADTEDLVVIADGGRTS